MKKVFGRNFLLTEVKMKILFHGKKVLPTEFRVYVKELGLSIEILSSNVQGVYV